MYSIFLQFPLLNSYAPNFVGFAPPEYVFSSYSMGGFKFQGPTLPEDEEENGEKEEGSAEKGVGKEDENDNNEDGGGGGDSNEASKKLLQIKGIFL